MLSRSIRWRLQSWHTLILALLLVGFGITAYQLQPTDRLRRVDDELNEAITLLSPAARPPPSVLPPDFVNKGANFYLSGNISRFFEVSQASGLYYVVWLADGSVQARSPNAPAEVPKPKRLGPDRWQSARMRGSLREVFRFTPMDRCLVVGRSVEKEFAALQRLAWWLAAAGGGGLAIGFAGGWWAATRAIQPLQDIIATAAKITDPSQRVSTSDEGNEVVRLAAVLNSTFERLEAAFARQKQFTGDAAHELRTPITVIISEAQTVLSWDREPAEYRESLDACLTAAQQMRRLTESLLHLARSDFGQELPRSEIDLASLAQDCAAYVSFHAQKHHIKIFPDLAPAKTFGSADQLRQVITNLLTNAIDYNRPYGQVHLSTFTENGCAIVTIRDNGNGIAESDLPHIFDRFYRADQARARSSGRSGLGLPICQAIVGAHGGTIEGVSTEGSGTTFTVRFNRNLG